MVRRLFLQILFALALGPLLASGAASRTLMVFGDSLSAGYGLPRDQAWPSLLAARLKQERFDYTVANASLSGETTSGGMRRIHAALARHQPAVVLIELGANDGLRGHSIDAMRKNLEAMIEASLKSRAQVVLIGMRVPPNYGSAYADKFHQTYHDVAQRYRVFLVPFLLEGFAGDPGWFLPDGVHPNARAQPLILDTVWHTLQPLLAAMRKK
jgi:acyl-CoA thioesterase-1